MLALFKISCNEPGKSISGKLFCGNRLKSWYRKFLLKRYFNEPADDFLMR